jgi:putative transposase
VPYWQHYCHLVWGTKRREPLIDEAVSAIIRQSVRSTCNAHRATLHALGMMPDHVHLAVSIPPTHAISNFVRAMKSASSSEINNELRGTALTQFGWQAEYGLLSFGQRSLDAIVAYVDNQTSHHAENTLWPAFEILASTHQARPDTNIP